MIDTIPAFLTSLADFFNQPQWRMWPFGPGYGDHILPSIARLAFCVAILGVILLFLRLLFGPKGIFRDKELDREAEEERLREIQELEEEFAKGDISELDYKYRLKRLEK